MPTCQPIIVTNPEADFDRSSPSEPVTIEALFGLVRGVLEQNRNLLEQMNELKKDLAISRPKEAYTVEEAAERLNRKPYTVRQWCNKGQVKDVYKVRGKGRQGEWRIPHEVLVKLQAEGPGPERGTAA